MKVSTGTTRDRSDPRWAPVDQQCSTDCLSCPSGRLGEVSVVWQCFVSQVWPWVRPAGSPAELCTVARWSIECCDWLVHTEEFYFIYVEHDQQCSSGFCSLSWEQSVWNWLETTIITASNALYNLSRSHFHLFNQQTRLDVTSSAVVSPDGTFAFACSSRTELSNKRRLVLHRGPSGELCEHGFSDPWKPDLLITSEIRTKNQIWSISGAAQPECFMFSWGCGAATTPRITGTLKGLHFQNWHLLPETELRKSGLRYLNDVFVSRLALHEGRDIRDCSIHLYGDHFDRNGHSASCQDGRVDDLGVLRRETDIHEERERDLISSVFLMSTFTTRLPGEAQQKTEINFYWDTFHWILSTDTFIIIMALTGTGGRKDEK